MPSVVYVLTNPAMPGIVKIGRTTQEEVSTRLNQLYTTGVPVPFTLVYAAKVNNPDEVEPALHTAFGPYRVNPRREFFRIDPEQAIAILKLLHTEDATNELQQQPTLIDQQSLAAAENLRTRRPNMNFDEMGIPAGAVLRSVRTDATATVVSNRRVRFADNDLSLSAATRQMMGTDYNLAPGPYWTYEGKLLRDIYEETYGESE